MKGSRIKKAILNTISEFGLELVTAICSFILPRLILSHFGSTYNGITQSISQFIGCIALLKSGIGSVTRAALYKPLADNDSNGISEVVKATENFMRRIAIIFAMGIIIFACIYPIFVKEAFDWWFTFTLVLILSISTFAQYYFGLTYQMVLQADQANYIIAIVQIIATILNTIIASILIISGANIHIVKLGSALVFIIPPIFYMLYVSKKYKISKNVKLNYSLISQRWDAFGHQLANFVNLNTDIIVITIILGVKEVSVYTIYYMVANAVKKIIIAFSSGTTAAFGNMIAKKEMLTLKKRFNQFEALLYYLATNLFTIATIMFIPFITIYTKGITDIEYIRPLFALLLCIAEWFVCTKIPYEQIVMAAGEFKNTRKIAFFEAGLHLILSIICTWNFGLNGVLIAYIIAAAFRTISYNIYVSKIIINRSVYSMLNKILFSILSFSICIILSNLMPLETINNYIEWICWGVVSTIITVCVATLTGFIFFKNDMTELLKLLKNTIKRKRK